MTTYKFTQTKEIANALNNVDKESFVVDFINNPYIRQDYLVKCSHDRNDDTIAVSTIGWSGASWYTNTPEGRDKAFKDLT